MSEIYAPVTGTVTARNDKLADEPELINSDPYGDGWLVEIEPADRVGMWTRCWMRTVIASSPRGSI